MDGSCSLSSHEIFGGDFWGFLPGIFVNQLGIFGGGFWLGVFGVLFTSFTEVFGYTNTIT